MTTHRPAIDFAPLHAPVDRWDGQYLVDQVAPQAAYRHWRLTRTVLPWSIAGLAALIACGVVLLAVFAGAADPWNPGQVVLFAAGAALVVVLYLSIAVSVVEGLLAGDRIRALARLIRFANGNGLTYEPIAPNRDYPGPRFAGVYLRDRLAGPDGAFDYGQRLLPGAHGAHTGSSIGWYLALPLQRALPHIVLASPGGTLAGAGEGTAVDVAAESAGASDRGAARLTCPPGGEAEASALFTPGLVAALRDPAHRCDAEVVESWLLVYPRRSTALVGYGREELHRRMLRIVAVAGESPLVRASGVEVPAEDAAHDRSGSAAHGVKIAALLVACVVPLVAATVPFWSGIAAQLTATIR